MKKGIRIQLEMMHSMQHYKIYNRKRLVFIQFKKGNGNECSTYGIIMLISYASQSYAQNPSR